MDMIRRFSTYDARPTKQRREYSQHESKSRFGSHNYYSSSTQKKLNTTESRSSVNRTIPTRMATEPDEHTNKTLLDRAMEILEQNRHGIKSQADVWNACSLMKRSIGA
jgi:hypothetical protein